MSVSGEMNLKQWVKTLPKIHRVRREYLQLTTDLIQAEEERDSFQRIAIGIHKGKSSTYKDINEQTKEHMLKHEELKADITTAESAVADLMELNDNLTAERDRLCEAYEAVSSQITLSCANIIGARPSGFKKDYPKSVPLKTVRYIEKANETIRVQVCNLIDAKVTARKILNHKEG